MHTDPKYRLREIRLARALAGSEVEGLRAIEEIRSISRLAHRHTEQFGPDDLDLMAVDSVFSLIDRHAKRAEHLYSQLLDACYEFVHAGGDENDDSWGDEKDYISQDGRATSSGPSMSERIPRRPR